MDTGMTRTQMIDELTRIVGEKAVVVEHPDDDDLIVVTAWQRYGYSDRGTEVQVIDLIRAAGYTEYHPVGNDLLIRVGEQQ